MSKRTINEEPEACSCSDPIELTPADTEQVSGGGANVRHHNPGGGPAPYNIPGNPGYGQSKE